MDVVRLIVDDDKVFERLDSFKHRTLSGGGEVLLGFLTEQRVDSILWCPRLIARLVKLLNVSQEQIARWVRLGGFAAENDFLSKSTLPFRWDQRQLVEDAVACKILLEALVHDDVRCHDEEI